MAGIGAFFVVPLVLISNRWLDRGSCDDLFTVMEFEVRDGNKGLNLSICIPLTLCSYGHSSSDFHGFLPDRMSSAAPPMAGWLLVYPIGHKRAYQGVNKTRIDAGSHEPE